MAKASTTKQAARKKAQVSPAVKQGKLRMREAWRAGNAIKKSPESKDGKTQTEEIRRKSGGNASRAEQLRKYRQIARQITWHELNEICNACEDHNRPWGPTFLVELSRIADSETRRKTYTEAIAGHWSLMQLQRHVSLSLGLSKMIQPAKPGTTTKTASNAKAGKKRKRVGRKRKVDWTSEVQVLYEMHRLCLSLVGFKEDIDREADEGNNPNMDEPIRTSFSGLAKKAESFNGEILKRIEKLNRSDRGADANEG